jgi:hypothetical protein
LSEVDSDGPRTYIGLHSDRHVGRFATDYRRYGVAVSGTSEIAMSGTDATTEAVLAPKLVGALSGHFFVPNYQRGYRWGRDEVTRLLDDVAQREGKYYLQPVVVKRLEDRWELVDGQQRLTTLFLILRYIRRHLPTASINYTLEYETRTESASYLENPREEQSQQNIDFFHIFEAFHCIREWFDRKDDPALAAIEFYQALSKDVHVIWYEAPIDVDSRTLFTRLNVGRIPLTDAELVKAQLLSKVSRQQEVAAQWDRFERDLRMPEVWSFVTGKDETEATHIRLLLDTISGGPKGAARPMYHTFETLRRGIETESAEKVWEHVVDLHSLVQGWYEDRDLFHKVGYLVATGSSFGDLVEVARGQTRTYFENFLDARIRQTLRVSRDALGDLSYEDGTKCEQALLLMNVETVRRRRHSLERYSFAAHASQKWSLEHISAQSAEKLNKAEQWSEWLRLHGQALDALPNIDEAERAALLERIDEALSDLTEHRFRALEEDVIAVFSAPEKAEEDTVHSIANLALLAGADNRALNNSCFEVKRRAILRLDREGSYIPPATRNVFLKYYTEAEGQQIHFWGPHDRTAYLKALAGALDPFLGAEGDDDD